MLRLKVENIIIVRQEPLRLRQGYAAQVDWAQGERLSIFFHIYQVNITHLYSLVLVVSTYKKAMMFFNPFALTLRQAQEKGLIERLF